MFWTVFKAMVFPSLNAIDNQTHAVVAATPFALPRTKGSQGVTIPCQNFVGDVYIMLSPASTPPTLAAIKLFGSKYTSSDKFAQISFNVGTNVYVGSDSAQTLSVTVFG